MIKKTVFLLIALVAVIAIYLYFDFSSSFILLKIRLPRLILALVTGIILAGVGSVFQVMLNNPLAEPYILGVSSGAAFGSVLAASLGLFFLMPITGFGGALLAMALVWFVAQSGKNFNYTKLILSGIVIGMFFSALISLLMYFNKEDIGSIMGILMGNLGFVFSQTEWFFFLGFSFISLLMLVYLYFLSNQLMILTTGDFLATSLGIDVTKLRKKIFLVCSILTGITVAYAGIIGFIGLMVPHIVRMIYGNNQKTVFIFSMIWGALIILICDFIAAHIAAIEIPIGVVTAFIGCPFFLYILSGKRKK